MRDSGEHWSIENVRRNFKGGQDPLYRLYRLAKTREDRWSAIRDMQRFNMDSRKYRGVNPPVKTFLRKAGYKTGEAFMGSGKLPVERPEISLPDNVNNIPGTPEG